MAAVGGGEMSEKTRIKSSGDLPQTFELPVANLIVNPVQLQPVTTLGVPPLVIGVPIMREDFITGTGLRPLTASG